MKINSDFLQIIFTTAAFGLVLYLSHLFADEPTSHFISANQPDIVETHGDKLRMETGRQPAKRSTRTESNNVIRANSNDVIH